MVSGALCKLRKCLFHNASKAGFWPIFFLIPCSAILAIFPKGLEWLCPVSNNPQKGLTGIQKSLLFLGSYEFLVSLRGNID